MTKLLVNSTQMLVFSQKRTFRTRLEIINTPQGILMVSGVAGTQSLSFTEKKQNHQNLVNFRKLHSFYLISIIFNQNHAFHGIGPPIPMIFLRDYWGFHARARKVAFDHKITKFSVILWNSWWFMEFHQNQLNFGVLEAKSTSPLPGDGNTNIPCRISMISAATFHPKIGISSNFCKFHEISWNSMNFQ